MIGGSLQQRVRVPSADAPCCHLRHQGATVDGFSAAGPTRVCGLSIAVRAVWEELRRPSGILGVIGAILGVVGIIASWYFYHKTDKVGDISLMVEQIQVFDKNRLGILPLRVLNSNGDLIDDNVFAANITIWNSGTSEIKKGDIRRPFHLTIGNILHPLDLTPTCYSHDNMDEFQVRPDGGINWEHFDPGEGMKIRIVYVSGDLQRISLEGTAAGIGDTKTYAPEPDNPFYLFPVSDRILIIFSVIISIGVLAIFTVFMAHNMLGGVLSLKKISVYTGLLLVMIFIIESIVIQVHRAASLPTPPC
jgi:hypothetical protein